VPPITESARKLLDWILGSGVLRGGADPGELLGILDALADCGDVKTVSDIVPFVFHRDLLVARTAATALERLLETAQIDDFVWLERHARVTCTAPHADAPWRQIRKRDVRRLSVRTGHFTATCSVLSLHWSGHVREEAVRQLASAEGPVAVPFVLLRLNDWVEEVRGAAVDAVRQWLDRSDLTPLALNLPLVTRLAGPVRSHHPGLVAEIQHRLLAEDPPNALLSACHSRDRPVRRQAFSLVLNLPGGNLGGLVDAGLASFDPVIRLRTLRRAVATGALSPDDERIDRALEDSFMPVRREALQALAEASIDKSEGALHRAVLDRHPAMRYTARWLLSRRSEEDFAGRYKEVLAQPASRTLLAAALGGLGEVGTPDDLPAVVPFLSGPTARIRAAAVRAAAKLSSKGDQRFLLRSLLDESPKVAREAAQALRGKVSLIGSEVIWECFQNAQTPHTRRQLLHFFAGLPVLERLIHQLRVASSPGDPLADEALEAARSTLLRPNLGYVRLSTAEVEEIQRELEALGGRLDEGVRRQVQLLVRACWA
jgi:HEAT repeat protein